jgi:Ca-activated chloride channel homolog
MTRFTIASLAALALAVPQTAGQQQPVFRSTSDVVPLFVTVTDKSGRLVPNLVREDFQVFDNGKLQPLTQFDHTPQPIRLIALIDVSGSVARALPMLKAACAQLVAHLTPGDLARVGTFGTEIAISPKFTRDVDELIAFLPQFAPPNSPTPLWRAVDQAITLFEEGTPGRRVVLVLSDGKDAPPPGGKWLLPNDISARAQKEDVMVYGVGIRSALQPGAVGGGTIQDLTAQMAATLPDPNLGTVAEQTGGGYFELLPRDNLAATFARVADELHSQYLLGFAPPAKDGKSHKIEIKMRGDGLKPRARRTYVAPK